MFFKFLIQIASTVFFFQQISAVNLNAHSTFSASLANELEEISEGFKEYNWSTAVPDPGPPVIVNGIAMPPKILAMSHEGSAQSLWGPGTFFTWEQWSAISGQNQTDHEHELAKRQDIGGQWEDDCGRNHCLGTCTYDAVIAHQEGYYDTFGNFHRMTGEVCGAGSAGRTYTSTYSWSFSLQVGPDFKGAILEKFTKLVDKIGIRVGGAYTWGKAVSTSYTMTFPQLSRGTVWYRPHIGVAHVPAAVQKAWGNRQGVHICSTSVWSKYDVHVPRTACDGCEADGLWGECFYRNVGPCSYTVRGRETEVPRGGMLCPANW